MLAKARRLGGLLVVVPLVLASCSSSPAKSVNSKGKTGAAGTSSAPTTSAPTTTSTTTTTVAPLSVQSANLKDVTVPGSVCDGTSPITVTNGTATITAPAGIHALGSQVVVSESGSPTYGDLVGNGQDVAAVQFTCSNSPGGTADSVLLSSWVIFSGATGAITALTSLEPQQASAAGDNPPFFTGIQITPGKVTAEESFFGGNDATCCPSGKATTVWTYSGGTFTPSTTVQST